jgi:hypothetical protein
MTGGGEKTHLTSMVIAQDHVFMNTPVPYYDCLIRFPKKSSCVEQLLQIYSIPVISDTFFTIFLLIISLKNIKNICENQPKIKTLEILKIKKVYLLPISFKT